MRNACILVTLLIMAGCGSDDSPTPPSGEPPTITTPGTLEDGWLGSYYSQTFTATGATPIQWTAGDSLPDGIALTEGGSYQGTPSVPDSFHFTVHAANAFGADSASYTHVIGVPASFRPQITSPSDLADGMVGRYYGQWFSASGVSPMEWTVSGSIPDGMTLRADGLYYGTPTLDGTFGLTVRVTNAYGADSASYTHVIAPPPPSLVLDTPSIPESGITGQTVTFRWHMNYPIPGETYTFEVRLDKGVNACDDFIEVSYDVGTEQCLTRDLPHSWWDTSIDWSVRATDSDGTTWCEGGTRFHVDPDQPPTHVDSCGVEE